SSFPSSAFCSRVTLLTGCRLEVPPSCSEFLTMRMINASPVLATRGCVLLLRPGASRVRWFVGILCCGAVSALGAPIPGLFNTGVGPSGALLAAGAVDPHWRMIQSADPAAPGPNAVVPSAAPIPPWLGQGPSSQWIAPAANQNTGSQPGNYTFRIVFDLTG